MFERTGNGEGWTEFSCVLLKFFSWNFSSLTTMRTRDQDTRTVVKMTLKEYANLITEYWIRTD